ncbi:geranylgeranyl diphosphate synthase [Fusarium pseudocircinatum]|uniref:Geranylgeranyl diphosphate synthase n=1 Tax=Fusarium pseudocircinatum TaxID=56676 RepID=A0A8H5NUV4_9HYPO|nr:geranylgeranyl diphosphate synthase [Fusarium pseudocircinatum]
MSTTAIRLASSHDRLPFVQRGYQAETKVTSVSSVSIAPGSDISERAVTDYSDLSMDPRVTDKPQLDAKTEWYYIQSHLHDATSTDKSGDPSHTVIVCLFRQSADNEIDSMTREHNWAVIYATLDWKTKQYNTYSKVPSSLPKHLSKAMEGKHTGLSKTIQSMLQAGPNCKDVPSFIPDDLLSSPVQVHQHKDDGPALHLEWDNGAILLGENGSYHLKVPEIELEIQVNATRPVMLHGHDGETLNDKTGAMFYYSWPRTQTTGSYRGQAVTGTAWVDHEYSLAGEETKEQPAALGYGWNWISLVSVDKDMEVCITQVLDGSNLLEQYVLYHDESGQRHQLTEFTLTSSEPWVSGHTFQNFDTCWKLEIPSLNVDLEIASVTENQEFQTWLRMPSFYEGAVRFSGTWKGTSIRGFGAMELVKGTDMSKSMEQILGNATAVVRQELDAWVPSSIRPDHFKHITRVHFDPYEEEKIQQNIVDAFYMLNNRGGKNWRPMLFGAAVGMVGGNANDWRSFLVLPELIHTASLIIDDIEDDSETRRGGPCVHRVVGAPTAINAGCAMYFWGETIIRDNEALSDSQRRDIYSMYFEMMRVGHAGQGLDIAGISMEKLPSIQDSERMLARVINLHRCKSGIPASFCGIVGAIVGGGTLNQIEALGAYVQNLGIAFQIRDDVLDVLGKVKGKSAADDLYNHKITYPVAKLFTLDHPDREQWFGYWQDHDVPALVDALKSSGTLDKCNQDIECWVRKGWDLIDALTPNSFSKALFSLFAEFLISDHY